MERDEPVGGIHVDFWEEVYDPVGDIELVIVLGVGAEATVNLAVVVGRRTGEEKE